MPLTAHIRVQTNLVVHKTKGNPRVAPFNNLTVPIFWVDLVSTSLAWPFISGRQRLCLPR